MEISEKITPKHGEIHNRSGDTIPDWAYGIYGLGLLVCVSVWLIAIRAPLWLDEMDSYWQIHAGFAQIWARQFPSLCFPAYTYILWTSTKIIGTSEVALRIPSVLAMLGAMYLLYLAARELFERDVALLAVVIFCAHPTVILESIDARPYAFGILATNAAILILLRLRHNHSNWLAGLFGLSTAFIVYFHYLFAPVLPALVLCFFVVKAGERPTLWRQFGIAGAAFAFAFVPVFAGLHNLFSRPGTHVWEPAPLFSDLMWTIAPTNLRFVVLGSLVAAMVVAAVTRQQRSAGRTENWSVVVCLFLALIPILILYGVSAGTSIRMFAPRHRLVAIPGISLCWAMFLSRYLGRAVRLLFCVALVTAISYLYISTPIDKHHDYTWKHALEIARSKASVDNAPVLVCSDFVESDYLAMPAESVKDDHLFAQLTYYPLSEPVVPLPMSLTDEATRIGSQFLRDAQKEHLHFLALGDGRSYPTLDWLAHHASSAYQIRTYKQFDNVGVRVLEFVPQIQASPGE